MAGTIVLIVALILAGFVLILFELLTPTFGPLAAAGLAALIGADWLAFTLSPVFGFVLLGALLVSLPIYVLFLVNHLHRLPFARNLFLEKVDQTTAAGTPEAKDLEALVGKTGTAETPLRPAGAVRVEGRRVVARAESGMIDAGAAVRIVASAGTDVVVRPVAQDSEKTSA